MRRIHSTAWRILVGLAVVGATPPAVFAQASRTGDVTEGPAAVPAIRRWVDVEQVQMASRYRWIQATNGEVTSSAVQWQPQLRARFLLDARGRVALHAAAGAGRSFTSGWDNTGAGLGAFSGAFNVKQLFVTAEAGRGVALAAGGLGILRGQGTEVTTYDNDGYLMGERLTWTPGRGPLAQVAVTTAYLGDLETPNVFRRFDTLDSWNYQQVLLGWRLADGIAASTDYTRDGDRHTLREAVRVGVPSNPLTVTGVRVELYERVSPDRAHGVNLSADARPLPRLAVTAGVARIDREYGTLNADRYGRGLHVYCTGSVGLTSELALGWFVGEAAGQDFEVSNEHRAEILLTFNPTATLRDRHIF